MSNTESATEPTNETASVEKPKRARKAKSPDTLATCLKAAQEQIKNVPKNGKNSFHNYAYSTAEDMIAACRHALNSNGLVAERSGWSLRFEPDVCMGTTKSGTVVGPCTVVVSRVRLTHAESGETLDDVCEYPAIPERGRPLDKAISGALSTSLSYWLRDTLQVPRCDYEIDIGESGQLEAPEPAPRERAPSSPSRNGSARTGSRTPGAGERVVAHYTSKLRAAVDRGAVAVERVGAEIKSDPAVGRGSDASLALREEYTACLEAANAKPQRAPLNDDEAERRAIEGGGW